MNLIESYYQQIDDIKRDMLQHTAYLLKMIGGAITAKELSILLDCYGIDELRAEEEENSSTDVYGYRNGECYGSMLSSFSADDMAAIYDHIDRYIANLRIGKAVDKNLDRLNKLPIYTAPKK